MFTVNNAQVKTAQKLQRNCCVFLLFADVIFYPRTIYNYTAFRVEYLARNTQICPLRVKMRLSYLQCTMNNKHFTALYIKVAQCSAC